MSFLKDISSSVGDITKEAGHAVARGPIGYQATKGIELLKGRDFSPGGERNIDKTFGATGAALLGAALFGPGMAGGASGAPGAGSAGGTGYTAGAPQIGAYPGITPGAAAPASSATTLGRVGQALAFMAANQAPQPPRFGGLGGGQIQSSKQNNRPVRR